MELKIEIPAKVEYMRIKHLPFLTELQNYKDTEPGMADIKRMCSLATGQSLVNIGRCPPSDIRRLFNQILQVYGTYKPKPVPVSLEYPDPKDKTKTIVYEFIQDFSKLPVDWFIDFDRADIEDNPIDMMAFCYIEKGMQYNQPFEDGSENTINPRSVRRKVFEKHLPLNVYLDVQAFFLASWNVLQQLSTKARSSQNQN